MLKKVNLYLYKSLIGIVVIAALVFVVSNNGLIKTSYATSSGPGTATLSPATGGYVGTQTITITCTGGTVSSLATIYYTTNGQTPTTSSYTGELSNGSGTISLAPSSSTITLEAGCYYTGYSMSNITVGSYQIFSESLPAPTFSPAAGSYTSAKSVTISCSVSSTIYYTNNGSTPTTSSSVYSSAISVSSSEQLTAMCVSGGQSSAIGSAYYQIGNSTTEEVVYNNTCIVSYGINPGTIVSSCPAYVSWISISPYQNLAPGTSITVSGAYVGGATGADCAYGSSYKDYYENGTAMDSTVKVDNNGTTTSPSVTVTLAPQSGNCNNNTTTGGWQGQGTFTTTVTAPASAGTYYIGASLPSGACTASNASNCEIDVPYTVVQTLANAKVTFGISGSNPLNPSPTSSWSFANTAVVSPCSVASCGPLPNGTYSYNSLSISNPSNQLTFYAGSTNSGATSAAPTGYSWPPTISQSIALGPFEKYFAGMFNMALADGCSSVTSPSVEDYCINDNLTSGNTYSYSATYPYNSQDQCTLTLNATVNGSIAATGLTYIISDGSVTQNGTYGSSSVSYTMPAVSPSATYAVSQTYSTYDGYTADQTNTDYSSVACTPGGSSTINLTYSTRSGINVQ